MSQEIDDLVRAVADAIARKDLPRLLELTDPDVEWESFLAAIGGGGLYRGHDGIRQYMADISEAFDFLTSEITDTLQFDDVVLMVARLRYRGRESQIEDEGAAGYVVQLRDGRVLKLRTFRDPKQAIMTIGLSE
jgi:ketosteroid isomerase-like protein